MTDTIREFKEAFEKTSLSPYATLSAASRGRRHTEKDCTVRTVFERDAGRILYCPEFRRLRQKTQVFFNPRNDHICTRMEHVIYVSYIARTIGRALRLNIDLIEAIALGHDLGHAPFGHSGERELNSCLRKAGSPIRFQHELHSLRVVDLLAERKGRMCGLNLSFEVRDGIVSHCGEKYQETELYAKRGKTEGELIPGAERHEQPATLEGCVVRMADRIAYVGRDIEDAARSGIMSFEDIPSAIRSELGKNNGEIINSLVMDIIANSMDQDAILLSRERAESMEALLKENVGRIYRSDKIERYEVMARHMVQGLFDAFMKALDDPEKLDSLEEEPFRRFAKYLKGYPELRASRERKVTDYIAGMTDHFAAQNFQQIYQI